MIAQIIKELINVSHDFVVQILKISGLNECMSGSIIFICEIKYCLIKKKKNTQCKPTKAVFREKQPFSADNCNSRCKTSDISFKILLFPFVLINLHFYLH